jgi:site-specific recombinase XerD
MQAEKYFVAFEKYLVTNDSSLIYLSYIKKFFAFCKNRKIDLLQMDYHCLSDYICFLKTERYKNTTINAHINAIKSFYKSLEVFEFIESGISLGIDKLKRLKIDRKIVKFITESEMHEAVSFGMTLCRFIPPIKLKAIIYFLFYTGLRKGELLNLSRKEINLDSKEVTVRTPTKNRLERKVGIPNYIRVIFRKFNNRENFVEDVLKPYFQSEPEDINAFNITVDQLDYLISSIKEFIPEEKQEGFSVHTLRHSFGHYAGSKLRLKTLQKLMGHKNLVTTEIYYDPTTDEVLEEYRKKIG